MAQGAVTRLKLAGAEVVITAFLITVITFSSYNILHHKTAKGVTVLSSGIVRPAIASSEPAETWQTVTMRVTAYCPCQKCCGPSAQGITASGHKIEPGEAFATADRRYPFGTELIIPGYNDNEPVKVLDRGGAIHGDHIDIFFATHEQALEWGVKMLAVKVRND
jgi:3D (Asp-Asp-Asp) domain-containing protein